MVDAKLADAVEVLRVSQQAGLDSNYPLSDAPCGLDIREALEPFPEFVGLANFDHL